MGVNARERLYSTFHSPAAPTGLEALPTAGESRLRGEDAFFFGVTPLGGPLFLRRPSLGFTTFLTSGSISSLLPAILALRRSAPVVFSSEGIAGRNSRRRFAADEEPLE